jgi:2-oxo-4-hydroxy-4-carboxy-5-ureidoimidazoline decarboxylase
VPDTGRAGGTALIPAPALASLDQEHLAAALRPLWEDAAMLSGCLLGRRFASWAEVIDAAAAEIDDMSDVQKARLLESHPPIGKPPERLRATSLTSWQEQGRGQGLDEALAERLADLNRLYAERFGFPFVEWIAGRPPAAIAVVIEDRIRRDRAVELRAGCDALVAIARDRLRRLEDA